MIPGPQELILILLIIVLVFGGKKIPEIMQGLGQGIRSFKKSLEDYDPVFPGSPPNEAVQPKNSGTLSHRGEAK
jgi:sec-independent protein translocase protein TatA